MGVRVVGAAVVMDRDASSRLPDAIVHRTAGVVVVAAAREAPRVGRVVAGVGVRRVTHVHGADGRPRLAVHSGNRGDGRRVRMAVVGRGSTGVGRDDDRSVCLADDEVAC